jgi:two-component system nitrogen regulation response regulator GlnG
LGLLQEYAWPGNVRELCDVLEYAAGRAPAGLVTADCLPEQLRAGPTGAAVSGIAGEVRRFVRRRLQEGEKDIYHRLIEDMDRSAIAEVLLLTEGNERRASELLGISRTSLRTKSRVRRRVDPVWAAAMTG